MVAHTPHDHPTWRDNIRTIIGAKKELVVLVLLSIIIRIPRVPGVIGDDAFVVLWMGRILSEGYFVNYTLSPFSILGLYPFVSYPIGIPIIVAFMLRLGLSFAMIVYIVSTTAGVVGTIGAYYLGRELFGTDQRPIFFAVFYSFSSVFINFTYFTITPRGSFLAVLPWFLYYSLKFLRRRNVKRWRLTEDGLELTSEATSRDLVIALLLYVVLLLIHGLAVFVIAYAAVVIGYYILRWFIYSKITSRLVDSLNNALLTLKTRRSYSIPDHVSIFRRVKKFIPHIWPSWFVYIALVGGAFILGLITVPIDPSKTTPFLFSNDTIMGKSWNLIVDYGIRLGLLGLFLPIGVIGAFKEDRNKSKKLVHIILVPPVMFVLPLSLYTSVLFLPVFGYYSVLGFDLVRKSVKDRWLGFLSVTFVAIFLMIYVRYAAMLPAWTIGFVFAIIVITLVIYSLAFRRWNMYHTTVGRQLRSWRTSIGQGPINFLDWQGIRIILISIIIISLITTEGIVRQTDFKYVTNDERLIYQYLGNQTSPGMVFVPTPVLGRRLEAYGFEATLSFNGDAALYFGWIKPSNITSNTHMSLSNLILRGRLFVYDGPDTEREIWNQLFALDLTSPGNQQVAIALGLEYVIVEKTPNGYSDTFFSIYGDYYSPLLASTPLACNRVVDGEHLSLFQIPV